MAALALIAAMLVLIERGAASDLSLNGMNISPGQCAGYGPYDAALYSIGYILSAAPSNVSFDVIFAYTHTDTNITACAVGRQDIVEESSAAGMTGTVSFSDHFVHFEYPARLVIANRGEQNITLSGSVRVSVSFADIFVQYWIYFVLGVCALALVCLAAELTCPPIIKFRRRMRGEIELGRL